MDWCHNSMNMLAVCRTTVVALVHRNQERGRNKTKTKTLCGVIQEGHVGDLLVHQMACRQRTSRACHTNEGTAITQATHTQCTWHQRTLRLDHTAWADLRILDAALRADFHAMAHYRSLENAPAEQQREQNASNHCANVVETCTMHRHHAPVSDCHMVHDHASV